MAAGNGNDQRVTNALLRREILALNDTVDEFRDDVKEWQSCTDRRIRDLEHWQLEHQAKTENNPNGNPTKKNGWLRDIAEKIYIPLTVAFMFWFLFEVLPNILANLP